MDITYNNEIEERFIPIEYNRLCSDILAYLGSEEPLRYIEFAELLSRYYHKNSYDSLQRLKDNYSPFSPEKELLSTQFSDRECDEMENRLFSEIDEILNSANYEILTKGMLEEAINRTSPYGVEVSVNLDDFDTMKIYFRGQSIQRDEILDPMKLYLKKKVIYEPIYRRLVIIIKPKQLYKRAKELAKEKDISIEKAEKKLKRNLILRRDKNNKNIYIKLFKNIPQMDLEMLFPNRKIKMRLMDKLKIGILGGGGTIGGTITLFSKLGTIAVDPISALTALGGFLGVLWRQVKGVLSRRDHYLAKLAQRLYFYNLANHSGALSYLIENANNEESKEVILTYFFLAHQTEPITKEELDRLIEEFIFTKYRIKMNFEIDDGIKKLKLLGMLIEEDSKLKISHLSDWRGRFNS